MRKKGTRAIMLSATAVMLAAALTDGGNAKAAVSVTSVLPASGAALILEEGAPISDVIIEIPEDETEEAPADLMSAVTPTRPEAVPTEDFDLEKMLISDNDVDSEGLSDNDISVSLADVVTLGDTEALANEPVEIVDEEALREEAAETVTDAAAMGAGAARAHRAADEAAEAERLAKDPENFSNLVIARVNSCVNVRDIPSTDGEVLGKLYDKSVGTFIEEQDGWYKISSGSVTGYVSAEYCVTGEEAIELAKQVGTRLAVVNTTTLKVRKEPSTEASVLMLVPIEEDLVVREELDGWVKVTCEEGEGYVSAEYVDLHTEFVKAESKAEEEARLKKEEEERKRAREAAERAVAQRNRTTNNNNNTTTASTTRRADLYVVPEISGSGLGTDVAKYACQFVGNPYVYGGSSLTNGTDCSGFVMSVYSAFGVSLPHSSRADRNVGSAVEGGLANAQPGDLVCYSGHVALYIGNGKIVHASSPKVGIVISTANYNNVLAVRRIF